jgi:hypothetical protein
MAPAGTPYVAFAEDASWWAPGALARVERWTRSTGRLLGAWPGGRWAAQVNRESPRAGPAGPVEVGGLNARLVRLEQPVDGYEVPETRWTAASGRLPPEG